MKWKVMKYQSKHLSKNLLKSGLDYYNVNKEKDYVVICDVGAYGTSLSSNYNVRPKPVELLIKAQKIKIINKRQKLSELI